MNNITPTKAVMGTFSYPVTQAPLRCFVGSEGQLWFVAKDVCNILDLENVSWALRNLDMDERGITISDTLGGSQELLIISEPGLYSLILRSRKPEAKPFKRWVTHDVLPSIRKYGAYATESTLNKMLADPQFCLATLTALDDERKQRQALESQVCEMRPKADVYDTVIADRQPSLRQFCRRFGHINLNAVSRDLHRLGILYRQSGSYHPYAKYRDTHFQEKLNHRGVSVMVVLDKGKQLLTELYKEGKLTCKK